MDLCFSGPGIGPASAGEQGVDQRAAAPAAEHAGRVGEHTRKILQYIPHPIFGFVLCVAFCCIVRHHLSSLSSARHRHKNSNSNSHNHTQHDMRYDTHSLHLLSPLCACGRGTSIGLTLPGWKSGS